MEVGSEDFLLEWRFHQTLRGGQQHRPGEEEPLVEWEERGGGGFTFQEEVFDFNHLCACTLREILSSEANSSS